MEQSSLIKVVAAFVAGVVVAVGSALIYVRTSENRPVAPPAQIQNATPAPLPTQLPDAGLNSADQTPPAAASDTEPAPAPEAVHKVHPKKIQRIAVAEHKPAVARHQAVEVAQNRMPSPPVYTPVPAPVQAPAVTPAPAVNEEANSGPEPQLPQTAPNAAVASTPAPVPVRQPHVVTLQPGTSLVIRLGETLSTDHNYTGDTFRATLDSPIDVDGFVIADRGSKVLGRIVNAQKAGRVEGLSDLALELTEINTTDGQRIRIDTSSYDKKGPTSTRDDGAKIAGGAALGAIIGAIAGGGKGAAIGAGAGGAAGTGTVLATRGKPAVLSSETRLSFRLSNPVTITEKLN